MLAYLVKDNLDERTSEELESVKYALDPTNVSVWSINDGWVRNDENVPHKTIQDERGLIRKNYFNDVMHQVIGEFNQLLEYYD